MSQGAILKLMRDEFIVGDYWVTVDWIAEKLKIGRSSILTNLRKLVEQGHLKKITVYLSNNGKIYRVNAYQLKV